MRNKSAESRGKTARNISSELISIFSRKIEKTDKVTEILGMLREIACGLFIFALGEGKFIGQSGEKLTSVKCGSLLGARKKSKLLHGVIKDSRRKFNIRRLDVGAKKKLYPNQIKLNLMTSGDS